MFKRRKPRTAINAVLHSVYPKGGWGRAIQYLSHRIKRIPDTPHGIACGLANGMAISFTPFIGGHLIGGLILCFLFRGNYLASALGTLIGNPLTFPFIWVLIYQTGVFILDLESTDALYQIMSTGVWMEDPLEALRPVFWPMTVGAIPYVTLCWLGTYLPVRAVVRRVKDERVKKIKKRSILRRKKKEPTSA